MLIPNNPSNRVKKEKEKIIKACNYSRAPCRILEETTSLKSS